MQRKRLMGFVALMLCAILLMPSVNVSAATTIYNEQTGTEDGYDYCLWKDYGDTSMTLTGGGTFECWWENIGNALFRKGKTLGCVQNYASYGNITLDYGVDYQPNGNSYLCVYGWSRNPLVEYYIVDSWGTWRPPGGTAKATVTIDGGTYEIYETTRVNQPSIDGNTTFKQYWSVRTSKRTSGTITVSDHFKAWANCGMSLGNLYEVTLCVEGYQSSGWANVYKNNLTFGGSSSSGSSSSGSSSSGSTSSGSSSSSGSYVTQCEDMTLGGSYAGKISSPFSGVALYANNDSVSYTQYFGYGTHNFTLRGCSNNDEMAQVDLYIGGVKKGTFYYGGSYPASYTIQNVSHGTGNQEVKLVCSSDNGTWDAYVDYLEITNP